MLCNEVPLKTACDETLVAGEIPEQRPVAFSEKANLMYC